MKLWIAIAFACACGGPRPAREVSTGSAKPSPVPPADRIVTACAALEKRCAGTDPAACAATLREPQEMCREKGKLTEYLQCAPGCLPSVRCEDDAAMNCAAGCGNVECLGRGQE